MLEVLSECTYPSILNGRIVLLLDAFSFEYDLGFDQERGLEGHCFEMRPSYAMIWYRKLSRIDISVVVLNDTVYLSVEYSLKAMAD